MEPSTRHRDFVDTTKLTVLLHYWIEVTVSTKTNDFLLPGAEAVK